MLPISFPSAILRNNLIKFKRLRKTKEDSKKLNFLMILNHGNQKI